MISSNFDVVRFDIEELLARAGFRKNDGLVGKAIAMYKHKNVPLNHVLAEVLIAHYLLSKGYEYVDVEHEVGNTKCDVYGVIANEKHCIEVEFVFVPPKHILNMYEYIIARHIKKLYTLSRLGIDRISFAYPRNVVPLVPIDFLRPASSRSKDRMLNYLGILRKYYGVLDDVLEYLLKATVYSVMFFDLERGKIHEFSPQTIEVLITLYEAFFV